MAHNGEHEHQPDPNERPPSFQRPERLRPRRLEPDTLSYMKEVTEMLTQPTEDTTEDEVELLLWNVLEELAPRAASASSDRHAGELIEVFMPKMNDGQLRYFFSKMHGYFSHLWTNRYSSHVLQHLLSRSSAIVEREEQGATDDPNDEDDRLKDTPPMSHLIITMVKEVESEWLTLMNDVSASHVMRSVLAVLAGKPLVPEKRGKKGKHRVVTFGEASAAKGGTAAVSFAIPSTFDDLFSEILTTFMAAHTHEILNLMYDRNAGPLLASALKLAPPQHRMALVERVLHWNDEAASQQAFYDFAGDAVTSHFLEALFASVDDAFFAALFHRCVQTKMVEFAQHEIANYVVQHAIERVRTPEVAREVLDELQPALWTLLSMGRPGVVWRLVALCVQFEAADGQREMFRLLVDAVKKLESKKPEAVQRDFVPALLGLQLSTGGAAKITLNVMGAKLVAELMQFAYHDWLAPLYRGILAFNTAQLVALAKDSTGSRFVIEPIWEADSPATQWVRDALYERFVGSFGSLALDRLGAFSVMKCYEKLSVAQKAVVADELVAVESKLAGSHFSQLVMNAVNLYEYRTNREKWAAQYEKQSKIAELFKDVVDDDDADNDDDAAHSSKKKAKKSKTQKTSDDARASKRKKKKRTLDVADDAEAAEKRAADVQSSADVLTIMDALRGGVGSSSSGKKDKKSKKKAKRA